MVGGRARAGAAVWAVVVAAGAVSPLAAAAGQPGRTTTTTTTTRLPSLTVDPVRGEEGTKVEATGRDFRSCPQFSLSWDDPPASVPGDSKSFTATITVPAKSKDGDHTLTARCSRGATVLGQAQARFQVLAASTPTTTPSPDPDPGWLVPIAIGAGVVILLVAVGVAVLTRRRRRPPPTSSRPPPTLGPEAIAPPPAARRHVNVWFARPGAGEAIARRIDLAAGATYWLRVGIGPLSAESIVDDPAPFPDELLPPTADGHWLEVAAISFDFGVSSQRFPVFLPHHGQAWICGCQPHGSHDCAPESRRPFLDLAVRTPTRLGPAKIRLAVYYRNNLVQSQEILATVRTDEGPGEGASAHVDFTLSDGLAQCDTLTPRTINILTNDDRHATHTIAVNGAAEDVVAFQLTEGQMDDAIRSVRTCLRDIHLKEFGGQLGARRQLENRYDRRNAKTRDEFKADLRRLAPLGRTLWDLLFADKPELRRELRRTLLARPAVIQVARTGGSSFVFPWGLVYDVPLEPGDPAAWTFCPLVDEWDYGRDAPGDDLPDRCPHEASHGLNTLCPFGFWGYHHVIEQPPTMPQDRTLPALVAAPPPADVVVGLSTSLDQKLTTAHLDRVQQELAGFTLHRADSRRELATQLANPALPIVYFYCHGARDQAAGAEPSPFLEVGDAERLAPGDLGAWFEEVWPAQHWRAIPPLVFINGCHTAEITPRTMLQFVDAFAGVYAAGVVGTEITIHQAVAAEAAEAFWSALRAGRTVGEALREVRLRLLRKANLMGLAYTAYCSASLQVRLASEEAIP